MKRTLSAAAFSFFLFSFSAFFARPASFLALPPLAGIMATSIRGCVETRGLTLRWSSAMTRNESDYGWMLSNLIGDESVFGHKGRDHGHVLMRVNFELRLVIPLTEH